MTNNKYCSKQLNSPTNSVVQESVHIFFTKRKFLSSRYINNALATLSAVRGIYIEHYTYNCDAQIKYPKFYSENNYQQPK